MPYALVGHKVEDYEKWKPVFDEDAANREASAATSSATPTIPTSP